MGTPSPGSGPTGATWSRTPLLLAIAFSIVVVVVASGCGRPASRTVADRADTDPDIMGIDEADEGAEPTVDETEDRAGVDLSSDSTEPSPPTDEPEIDDQSEASADDSGEPTPPPTTTADIDTSSAEAALDRVEDLLAGLSADLNGLADDLASDAGATADADSP